MIDSSGAHKDVRQLLRKAEAQGCTVSRTKSGHWRLSRPGRPYVTVANSPSDARSLKNARADAKRYLDISL